MKNISAKIDALKPLREAKMRGRIEKSKLRWKRRIPCKTVEKKKMK
ncbi:MAG: hypothetical protein L6265_06395 [Thermoplasmatales archaeon]|nr:hypothetical protein [Thermoplasmatales archaeon]